MIGHYWEMNKRKLVVIPFLVGLCLVGLFMVFYFRTPYPLNLVQDLLSDDFYTIKHATESFPKQGTKGSRQGAVALVNALDDPAYSSRTDIVFNVLSHADREMCRQELIRRLPSCTDDVFVEVVEVINSQCFSDDADSVDTLMTVLQPRINDISGSKKKEILDAYEGSKK